MDLVSWSGIMDRWPVARVIVLSVLAGTAGVTMTGHALAGDPTGMWTTEDGEAQIRVEDCGGALCGTIVSLHNPVDAKTGRPVTDKNNPDATRRNLPLIGVQILRAMKPSGKPDKWNGDIYNPQDGNTYQAQMIVKGAAQLRVEGCMLFICSGETWKRSPVTTGSTAVEAGVGAPVAAAPSAAPDAATRSKPSPRTSR